MEYDFAERRRKLRIAQGKESPPEQKPDFDASGDVPDPGPERSEEDHQIDKAIASIDIIQAYNRWCGKSTPKVGSGQTESIMISCPVPGHRDAKPSAWINTDDQIWYCSVCDIGGDIHDIAAYHFGYPVPDYKKGATFHRLRRQMAEEFDYKFKSLPGGKTIIYKNEPEPPSSANPAKSDESDEPDPSSQQSSSTKTPNNVSVLYADDNDQETFNYPSIPWREVLVEGTFLRKYVEACSNDDSPEEYHVWYGLLALAHAAGRNITLDDGDPVYSNLLVCLLGGTGVGKSRSRRKLNQVIKAVMPYTDSGLDTSGVKIIPMPGSGEYLVGAFQYEARDPSNPKVFIGRRPINGIVDYDEFATLLAKGSHQSSTLKQRIMEFADASDWISTASQTRGDIIAVDAFCSITASTQPKAVRAILARTDTGSGFLNRWVFAGGPPKKREVLGGSHSSRVIDLEPATEELKKVYGWAGKPHTVTMTEDGLDAIQQFFENVVYPTQERDDTDLLKRLDLLFKKLILLFCINEKRKTADAKVVERVERLFKYVIDCYSILNMQIGVTVGHEIAREIERHIIRHEKQTKRGATVRDLRRYMARKNYAPDQLLRSLETMVKLDIIEIEQMDHSKTGPKTPRYRVVKD